MSIKDILPGKLGFGAAPLADIIRVAPAAKGQALGGEALAREAEGQEA